VTFRDVQRSLLAYVQERIHNGEFTERGFARLIGISQPHAHNVLKGARNLSPAIVDSILKFFQISMIDLIQVEDLEANLKKRKTQESILQLALLESPLGPGRPWPARIDRPERYPLPFEALSVPPGLVMARLAADPAMFRTLGHSDLAILDTSELKRALVSPLGLYAVSRGREAVLRRLQPNASCCDVLTDSGWEARERAVELMARVKARVLWLGREQDRWLPPRHQRGRFL
jgi:plasmid maintenance system antidote protein VapI